tara:strand:- start:929 stop:1207 length:279 start_codon:yes stop_codon:yes gene_type:complete
MTTINTDEQVNLVKATIAAVANNKKLLKNMMEWKEVNNASTHIIMRYLPMVVRHINTDMDNRQENLLKERREAESKIAHINHAMEKLNIGGK